MLWNASKPVSMVNNNQRKQICRCEPVTDVTGVAISKGFRNLRGIPTPDFGLARNNVNENKNQRVQKHTLILYIGYIFFSSVKISAPLSSTKWGLTSDSAKVCRVDSPDRTSTPVQPALMPDLTSV